MFSLLNNYYNQTNINSNNSSFNNFIAVLTALQSSNNHIIIAPDNATATDLYNLATYLNSNNKNVFYFPALFTTPYQKFAVKKSLLHKRMHVLNSLLQNSQNNLVITTAMAFISKIISTDYLQQHTLTLKTNQKLSLSALKQYLVNSNYQHVGLVNHPGSFAIRGDIIDICTLSTNNTTLAVRIDMFDDTIEQIRVFNTETQTTISTLNTITLFANTEIIFNPTTIQNFTTNYLNTFNENNPHLIEQISQNIVPVGIEHLITLLYSNTNYLHNYLPNCTIIDTYGMQNLQDLANKHISAYVSINKQISTFSSQQLILHPSKIIASANQISSLYSNHNVISFSNNPSQNNYVNCLNFDVQFASFKANNNHIQATINFIKQHKKYNIVIFTQSQDFYTQLTQSLTANNILFSNQLNNTSKIKILETNFNINANFIANNTIITTEYNITGVAKTWVNQDYVSNNTNYKKILQQLSTIGIGDIVVHNKHGLGKYLGITNLTVNNIKHDFLEIEYKNCEKLFVPVENIDLISLYSSSNAEDVVLDKLGSNNFETKQQKVKEQIKDIAYDLVKISANREIQKGIPLEINSGEYNQFAKEFLYVETNDQKNAINDIINDVVNQKPIDRLICGDVGFGKTEVAMRACFLFANGGYQVIVIAPTTLLVEQHYKTFKNRFANFNITIDKLSRFTSAKHKKEIVTNLANGSLSIIIGTHAVLSSTIKYKNLGLIVIDEEQSFGVVQKEYLKSLKANSNVLTLSATPIPRTLQLSLKGVKDLSLITTPPTLKLPINTYVLPVDYLAIKEAILNEVTSGGQVFFVCPKIADITELTNIVESLNLNIKSISLHGQMPKEDIENNMIAFESKEFDLLICTNIIESGLNLKNVNTIIIYNSNNFGLSQLYQLRGRVGRGNIQGNAYLLYNPQKLTPKAQKRLEVMQSLDYLGASFTLASYDLDIRGAGNLLGEQQSGHIKEIGFDLYQKLLQQEINNLKQNNSNSVDLVNFSPSINLNIPIFLPKTYINNIEVSMQMYQKIGNVKNITDLEDIKTELLDRFGAIPEPAQNLLTTVAIKLQAQTLYIEKIIASSKGIAMYFYNNNCPYVDKLLTLIANPVHNLSIKPPSVLFLNVDNTLNPNQEIVESYANKQIKALQSCLNNLKNLL